MKIPIWFNMMKPLELLLLAKKCVKEYNSVGAKQYEIQEVKNDR